MSETRDLMPPTEEYDRLNIDYLNARIDQLVILGHEGTLQHRDLQLLAQEFENSKLGTPAQIFLTIRKQLLQRGINLDAL